MAFLETVGALAVGSIGLTIAIAALETIREVHRAFQQTCRVARYTDGKTWRAKLRDRRCRQRFWWQWWTNIGGGEFMIGLTVFPADPSKPLRRSWTPR